MNFGNVSAGVDLRPVQKPAAGCVITDVADLQTAVDQHAILSITDPQGRITFVSDKFCAISKYARHELVGRTHHVINSGHHPTEFFRNLWQTITRGAVWRGDVRNRAK